MVHSFFGSKKLTGKDKASCCSRPGECVVQESLIERGQASSSLLTHGSSCFSVCVFWGLLRSPREEFTSPLSTEQMPFLNLNSRNKVAAENLSRVNLRSPVQSLEPKTSLSEAPASRPDLTHFL